MPPPTLTVKEIVSQFLLAKANKTKLKKSVEDIVSRKIQQTGTGSFFVCLPKKWAAKLDISKGQEMVVVWTKDDTLVMVAP